MMTFEARTGVRVKALMMGAHEIAAARHRIRAASGKSKTGL
jgi:hypothetical protein